MTLLNGLLALGALAFSIPLVIHLLHRSRFTTVEWGAWHLLDSVVRVNRKRMQFTNLLLLLLRCLIPILLAFCLARPVLTGFQSLPGDAPESLIIALDDSRSMDAAAPGESTRLEQAKASLTELLKTKSRRDEVIFLRSSAIDAPAGSMGVADAIARIRNVTATGGPVELSRLVKAAVESASEASHAQRSVLIASDFQSETVGTSTLQSLESLTQQIEQQDPKPIISFLRFDQDTDDLANLSIDAVTVDSPAVVAGRNAQFSARIRNASDNPARDLRVIWSIDGVPLAPRLASVEGRASATARLSHKIDDPGVHEVTVSVEYGDALAADNRRSIGVDVMREIKVMLVDGKPSKEPLDGQADFLAIALSPFAFGGDDQPDAVSATVIPSYALAKKLVNQPEILVLANVRRLKDTEKSALANFVLSGGSLIVFDGDSVRPEDFNEPWHGDRGDLEFPAVLEGIQGDPAKQDTAIAQIGELNPQYTPWKLLAPGDQRPLNEVDVYAYRQMKLAEQKVDDKGNPIADDAAPVILLRFSDGSPMVVSAARGAGQVVQFGLPCNASWSTLPLRMAYLPMMQQLVLDLAGRRKTTTLQVGQPMAVPVDELVKAALQAKEAGGADDRQPSPTAKDAKVSFTLETPDQDEVSIRPTRDKQAQLVWPKTQKAGVYQLRRIVEIQDPKTRAVTKEIAKTMRVAEVPKEESVLRNAEEQRLVSIASDLDAKLYSNLSELQSDDRVRRFGREIWRWLLFALLIAMVGELLLQQYLVRHKVGAS